MDKQQNNAYNVMLTVGSLRRQERCSDHAAHECTEPGRSPAAAAGAACAAAEHLVYGRHIAACARCIGWLTRLPVS